MNKYLEKIAKQAKPGSMPHHEEALAHLDKTDGLVVDHSLGSGKTSLYLKAIEHELKKHKHGRALVIAPASLTTNIDKEIKKFKFNIPKDRLDVYSYEAAANRSDQLQKNKYLIAAVDEAHKLRNTRTSRYQNLHEIIQNSDKRILGTGTPVYNSPQDIAVLSNLAAGRDILPTGRDFDNRYLRKIKEQPSFLQRMIGAEPKEVTKLVNREELSHVLKMYVHRYDALTDPKMKDRFPTQKEHTIEVEMDPEQLHYYKFMEHKLPWHIRTKIRMNMPLTKQESADLNAFSSGVRQVSSSTRPFGGRGTTPKIKRASIELKKMHDKDPNFKGIVYSKYLGAGIDEYSEELTKHNIPHAIYTGKLSKTQKDEVQDLYNKGKIKVMLVSDAGAEGLNLKGTKLIQTLSPHFNSSLTDQVKGRGIRLGSHEHLPEEDRHVTIQNFHSVHPNSVFGKRPASIDSYLASHSDTKQDLAEDMRKLYA